MKKQIKVKQEIDSIDKLFNQVKKISPFDVSLEYDVWDLRTDKNGQMEKCILLKKNSMHGLKMYVDESQNVYASYIIPNKILNAYLGKSQKKYRNVLEILTSKLLSSVLAGPQNKAFNEMFQPLYKLSN